MKQSITLMGMSGVGKTTLSNKLPKNKWFHYSGDYRIATYYLKDQLHDFLKKEVMQSQSSILQNLLKTDSIKIAPKLTIDNLGAISAYISKIGNPEQGGLDYDEFKKRQKEHYQAELNAIYDITYFKNKAKEIYHYDYFLFDAGGSICEMDDDNAIRYIAKQTKIIYIHANEQLAAELTNRALLYPKPMYYNPEFLSTALSYYLKQNNLDSTLSITPDKFIQYIIPNLMNHREKRYQAIADQYGMQIDAHDVFKIRDEKDFLELIKI